MAVTIVKVAGTSETGPRLRKGAYDITFDSSYASGGEPVAGSDFGFRTIIGMEFIGGNAASAGYHCRFDTTNSKIVVARSGGFTPAGTNDALTFTGSALTAHRHVLHFQTSAAANAVTAAANSLRTAAAAFDVAGVANSSGEGGVVDVTGGTPAGTINTPAFAGTAVAQAALAEVTGAVNLTSVTVRVIAHGV